MNRFSPRPAPVPWFNPRCSLNLRGSAACFSVVAAAAAVAWADPPPTLGPSASARPNPALAEVRLPAHGGWNATLVLDNQGVGIWTVEAFPVFPQTGTPEIVGLDDLGRVHVCAGYSGKWTPTTVVSDGRWLGGLAHGDVDPRIAGAETYTGSQQGNLYQVVAWPHGILDYRLLSRPPGFGRAELAGGSAGGPRDTVEPFDAVAAGRLPGGWTAAITGEGVPCWTVERDTTAFSPPQVLRQSGVVPKPAFPLCLVERSALQDGFVETRFRTVSGEIDQAAGLVWRARDAANYYVCRANALEDNVVLYKVQDGQRQALDILGRTGGYGVEAKVPPAVWHTLRVEFVGSRFRVGLDGRHLFEVEDATFGDAGRVGLWTKADSVTVFDDFTYGRHD